MMCACVEWLAANRNARENSILIQGSTHLCAAMSFACTNGEISVTDASSLVRFNRSCETDDNNIMLKKRTIASKLLLGSMLLAGHASDLSLASTVKDLKLWYDRPATNWNEALPLGNGRLGAMVFGGVTEARSTYSRNSTRSSSWTPAPASSSSSMRWPGR